MVKYIFIIRKNDPTVLPPRSSNLKWNRLEAIVLTFYQFNNKQDAIQLTEISVPLITKWIWILRTKDTSWACQSAIPDGHGLVKEYLPRGKEDGSHVIITCLYHLENLPKFINIGWGVSVS